MSSRIDGEKHIDLIEQLTRYSQGVQEDVQGYQELEDLREAQRPYIRLQRDLLLGELRTMGVIQVAEHEANCVLGYDLTYFKLGNKRLSTHMVQGGPLDPSKPYWQFSLDDVEYDFEDKKKLRWKDEGLKFRFSKRIKEPRSRDKAGVEATVKMVYSPTRQLVISGAEVNYEAQFGFDKEYREIYEDILPNWSEAAIIFIERPKDFDLETFRQGLKESLVNPKKYPLILR